MVSKERLMKKQILLKAWDKEYEKVSDEKKLTFGPEPLPGNNFKTRKRAPLRSKKADLEEAPFEGGSALRK